MIIVSALSLSLRDKERFRDWEIERAWQFYILSLWNLFETEIVANTDGNAIGTAGAIAPPQKDESILVGTTLTMETILCLIKAS